MVYLFQFFFQFLFQFISNFSYIFKKILEQFECRRGDSYVIKISLKCVKFPSFVCNQPIKTRINMIRLNSIEIQFLHTENKFPFYLSWNIIWLCSQIFRLIWNQMGVRLFLNRMEICKYNYGTLKLTFLNLVWI